MIRSSGFIIIDMGSVTETLRLSVAIAVKFDVPAEVGVPVILPLEGSSDNPAGRDPALMDQVYGSVPPEATSVWE
jgi:hypothetical protein